MEFIAADESKYSLRDLIIFAVITIIGTNLATIFSEISLVVLTVSYFLLEFVGIMLFVFVIYKILKEKASLNESKNYM